MEVNKYGSVMSSYLKTSYEPAKLRKDWVSAKNTDKADFSAASKGAGAVAGAKAAAKREVEGFASAERIAELKSMIADGSYNIPAESVAASILE